MAGASQGFHEAEDKLSRETKDAHRALVSLQEELEAIDWYAQRADAADNAALRAVLLHNRNEEVEHACMLLEWLRRNVPVFDTNLKTYLFREESITEIEGGATGEVESGSVEGEGGTRLTVGTMKGE